MMRWRNVNLEARQLRVEESEWRGQFTTTKSGCVRHVPMTTALADALREYRHLRGPLVLYREDGSTFSEASVRAAVDRAARTAGLRQRGPHMLRHTFCSHLAMNGAQPQVIQAFAGHQSVLTTQRYMHLSPGVQQQAIQLLEQRPAHMRGDSGETVARNQ